MAKELVLQVEKVEGISEKTNKGYSFNTYYVEINGIRLTLKPSDNTVRQVLEQYYEKGE